MHVEGCVWGCAYVYCGGVQVCVRVWMCACVCVCGGACVRACVGFVRVNQGHCKQVWDCFVLEIHQSQTVQVHKLVQTKRGLI